MLLRIPQVLNQNQLDDVRRLLATARFVDGKISAGMAAKRVKNNQEMAGDAEQLGELNKVVMGSLVNHSVYLNGALPHRVAAPYYARYTTGMAYGDHIDDPVMGPGPRYRSDIAITIFLNDIGSYDGGELVIRASFGNQEIKLPAGDGIMYPASSFHHVAAVTRGERLVATTWVQSLVRDSEKRQLLYDLHLVREKLLETQPDTEETARVNMAYVNLVRMWAEL